MGGGYMFDAFVNSNAFFLVGIALMALSVIGMIVSAVILHLSGKRLRAKLEEEFGKKRR